MSLPRRRIHYTDLNVWKKSSEFTREVSDEIAMGLFAKTPELRSQLFRSALSVSSNIAEGEGQGTNRATLKFYFIARGSLYEARTQLTAAFNQGCLSQTRLKELDQLADDVARLISGVIRARRAREEKLAARPRRPAPPQQSP